MLGYEMPVPVGDNGCLPVAAARIFHIARSAEADSGVPDRAAWFACSVVDDADRVTLLPDPPDRATGEGDFEPSE